MCTIVSNYKLRQGSLSAHQDCRAIKHFSVMAHKKSIQALCDRELLEKILGLVESQKTSPVQNRAAQAHRVYDNKTLMEMLRIKDKYLKKLRDNGYLGYSREGDKYWYTQEDVDGFLRRFHYEAFAIDSMLPEQQGGGYV